MAVIGGILESPNKLRVDIVNYLTDDVNSAPNGIICDAEKIPPFPEHQPGKAHLLYVDPTVENPQTNDFWFEEISIPLTPDEEQSITLGALKVAAQIATRALIKAEELDEDEYNALIGVYPNWKIGVSYKVGELVAYNGKLYEVIQAHTSQSDWAPDVVPALFVKREPVGVIPEWVQPTGSHDAYAKDSIVTHNGQTWISLIAANVWEPGAAGTESLWVAYTT